MRYWQHGETGICCAVDDEIDLSQRHIEITKEQYEEQKPCTEAEPVIY